MIKNPATSFLKISTCWVLILEEIPVYKKGQIFEQFQYFQADWLMSVVSFYNFQWTRQYLDFFSWKPCKFELPFHSVACSIGVGVKFVFSIEGVGCEVTGLQYRSLVTGGTSKTIWWHISKWVLLTVATSYILILTW